MNMNKETKVELVRASAGYDNERIEVQILAQSETFDLLNEERRWKKYDTHQDCLIYVGMDEDGLTGGHLAYSGPGNGFCGSKFNLTMEDGSVETLIGPWSGAPSSSNRFTGLDLCESTLYSTDGGSRMSGYASVPKVAEALGMELDELKDLLGKRGRGCADAYRRSHEAPGTAPEPYTGEDISF